MIRTVLVLFQGSELRIGAEILSDFIVASVLFLGTVFVCGRVAAILLCCRTSEK
jgi:hypothetical protein